MLVTLKEVVTSPEQLMGVKAVWDRSTEAVMCFRPPGGLSPQDERYFAKARRTAERAQDQPYFLTIGGGKEVPGDLRGRVLELVRATGAYGETRALVRGAELRTWLARWPVAIAISEVYSVVGEPHLIDNLKFPDLAILSSAFDAVKPDKDRLPKLWEALKDREVRRRWEVMPPPGFRDPGKPQMCGSMYPRVDMTSAEGWVTWALSKRIERDPKLAREAKALNRAQNGGILMCEACRFSDPLGSMFDVHHREPLAKGLRESRVDQLAVLCPTCHRWAHAKAQNMLSPMSIEEVAALRSVA